MSTKGSKTPELVKQKIRLAMKGKNKGSENPMYGVHLIGEKSGFWGKHHSEESREKMRRSHAGKPRHPLSEETKEKIRRTKISERNENWKGDYAKYSAIHMWINKYKPKPLVCEICHKEKKLEASNTSGKYLRDINDYKWLCHSCHCKIDKRNKTHRHSDGCEKL